jgi:hypothetical protein
MLVVRPYGASNRAQWDALVARSSCAHFLFLRDYMEYHADRFRDLSLMVHDDRQLLAVLPANVDDDELVSHGGLTFGGLVADPRLRAAGTLSAFEAILSFLRESGIRRLVYKCVPHIYHRFPAEDDLYALFRCGARLVQRDLSSTIALSARLPYGTTRRQTLGYAEAAGLTIERSSDFGAFMDVEAQALERHGVTPAHSAAELALLVERFPENIKLHTATAGGELVAGVVMYETEVVAHAQYMAATAEGRAANALTLIVDRLIESYASVKRYFDFGISTTDAGRSLNSGLVQNKESYGARGLTYDRYEIDI